MARILAKYEELGKADRCALLRRERSYTSLISAWRDQRDKGALAALAKPAGRPGGRKPIRRIGKTPGCVRERVHVMIDEAITELTLLVGTREACQATGRPQANQCPWDMTKLHLPSQVDLTTTCT
ncbi:hypothetical protein GCM10027521_56000 [Amycolatopsis cihanbeyliensis]